MIKKQLKAIIIILIFLLSGVTPVVSFSSMDNDNEKRIDKIIDNFNVINIENEDIEFDELRNQSIELMKRMVGNESEIGSCGRAFINSRGIGLHLARVRPLLQIILPIEHYGRPYLLMFPRLTARMFYICSIYGRDENAETIIQLRDTNETIHLKGPHIIIGGIFLFLATKFAGYSLEPFLPLLDKIKIWSFPLINILNNTLQKIKKYDGSMFWHNFNYWKEWKINESSIFEIIDFLMDQLSNKIIRRQLNILIWNLMPVKSQLIGLITPLKWRGYYPFFVWSKL